MIKPVVKNNKLFQIEANKSVKLYNCSEKSLKQAIIDFIYFPLRALLPYKWVQMLHLTDLGRERRMASIPYLKGLLLDVGCGPINQVKNEYSNATITCDIYNWGDLDVVCSAEDLSFMDNSFDSVLMLACLNHFVDKSKALSEAYRILKPEGVLVLTMPSKFIGTIVHLAVSWFDYDHIRGMDKNEEFGLSKQSIIHYLQSAGFELLIDKGFVYNLNRVYVARKHE